MLLWTYPFKKRSHFLRSKFFSESAKTEVKTFKLTKQPLLYLNLATQTSNFMRFLKGPANKRGMNLSRWVFLTFLMPEAPYGAWGTDRTFRFKKYLLLTQCLCFWSEYAHVVKAMQTDKQTKWLLLHAACWRLVIFTNKGWLISS